jgi:hypothetical protein
MMNILVNSISLPGLDSLGPIASSWLVGEGLAGWLPAVLRFCGPRLSGSEDRVCGKEVRQSLAAGLAQGVGSARVTGLGTSGVRGDWLVGDCCFMARPAEKDGSRVW